MFKRTIFSQRPNEIISDDRFRQVEMAIAFKRLLCYHCRFEAIYKYAVQQIRRHPEIQVSDNEEVREDHRQIWKTIPRFALHARSLEIIHPVTGEKMHFKAPIPADFKTAMEILKNAQL